MTAFLLPPTKALNVLIAAALPLIACNAHARLDETPEQCATRYGQPGSCEKKPDEHNADVCIYHPGNFVIAIYFLEGKAAVLLISEEGFSEFKAEEVELLLGANAGGADWSSKVRGEGPHQIQDFRRSDGRASASLVGRDQLMIESTRWTSAKLGMDKF
jgi:hypothetical protein